MKQDIVFAIVYDFDKTLCKDNSTDIFIKNYLKKDPIEFWGVLQEKNKINKIEPTLSYMLEFIRQSNEGCGEVTKDKLFECGQHVEFFPGVENYFNKINNYFHNHFKYETNYNFHLEHHIISSGLKEIIEGTSIAKYFTTINACSYYYENNKAIWPQVCISAFGKPEYLFRIRKRDNSYWDRNSIYYSESIIDFKNLIYIGDGETDIPSMVLTNRKHGTSICVINDDRKGDVKFMNQLKYKGINHISEPNYDGNIMSTIQDVFYNRKYYTYYKGYKST